MGAIKEFRNSMSDNYAQGVRFSNPKIKITNSIRGKVIIYRLTLKLLKVTTGDSVMFAFDEENKIGYIYKEDPKDDSFYLRTAKEKTGREKAHSSINSIGLWNYIRNLFGKDYKAIWFTVNPTPDIENRYSFQVESIKD